MRNCHNTNTHAPDTPVQRKSTSLLVTTTRSFNSSWTRPESALNRRSYDTERVTRLSCLESSQ